MSLSLACVGIVADIADPAVHDRIHRLEHQDAVETIRLPRGDLARHRFRATTDKGTDCAVALPRSEQLFDGAVLYLDAGRAVVVRAEPERWLVFRAATVASALELGYFAGNMHWPVRFEGDHLYVAAGPGAAHVLERLHHLIDRGAVSFVGEDP